MSDSNRVNQRIVLAERPTGRPAPTAFRLERVPVPQIGPGQILLRTLWLSLDPYMRGRMSGAASYAAAVEIGAVMIGGTVARVEASLHQEFQPGDLVVSMNGWQEYAVSSGTDVARLPPGMPHPSLALGVLGMPGATAYIGLLDIGKPRPGDTVVVAAATGAVGSVVGQLAGLKGCRVVGIAGGPEKCAWAVRELGFEACLDHRAAGFAAALSDACPRGIDVYFENVGGAVFRAVLPLLNDHARVPVCGLISMYNETAPPADGAAAAALLRTVLVKRLVVQGFIVSDTWGERREEIRSAMSAWVAAGRIKYREDVVRGLARAPEAFLGMLEGRNFGKLVVEVAGAPA